MACIHAQIFRAVVAFIFVDMVYDLTRLERSAEHLFGDYSMLVSAVEFAVGFSFPFVDSSVSVCFSVSIFGFPSRWVPFGVQVFHVARLATPYASLCLMRVSLEGFTASRASAYYFAHVSCSSVGSSASFGGVVCLSTLPIMHKKSNPPERQQTRLLPFSETITRLFTQVLHFWFMA